ncbi:MAG: ribulose 1,5-bisphosphate carboxylase large subunit [Proteobacteria bacterium]|nr:ribulose 1,5-bisphosphate carboxylase large subunit [Pseudomonadota bacterium]
MTSSQSLNLSREYFKAVYHLTGTHKEAASEAQEICLEQTVEFPKDLIKRKDIEEQIVGRLASLERMNSNLYEAVIEFPVEVAGVELTQLLNVLFGNVSIKPGICLKRFSLSGGLLENYKGPRFGRHGLRNLLNAPVRPLLGTAIKPMGLSPEDLADLAYKFSLGGIDIIKDDHGLSDQSFCRFDERVKRCSEAVNKANEKTGHRSLYFPNITAPADEIMDRACTARDAGAGGLVISPGLTGLDTMRCIADNDELNMPVLSHPAMQGAFTVHPNEGISHGALYGQINRLSGADACIFPNYGGRFFFTPADCRDIADSTTLAMGEIKSIFPVPAGGMSLDRIPELLEFYGNDVILLIGGDLHRHGDDLVENCHRFADDVGL